MKEVAFGKFWDTNLKGWAVFIDGKPVRRVNGMNPKVLGTVRCFKTKESAEAFKSS